MSLFELWHSCLYQGIMSFNSFFLDLSIKKKDFISRILEIYFSRSVVQNRIESQDNLGYINRNIDLE